MSNQVNDRSKFLEAIRDAALQDCNELEEQVRRYARDEMRRAEDKIHNQCHQRMEAETARIERETQRRLNACRTEARRRLSERRAYIEKQVFDEARVCLTKLYGTPQYRQALLESAGEMAAQIYAEDTVFYVCPGDLEMEQALKQAFGKPCTVTADDKITLGGIRAVSAAQGISMDDTWDARLEQQRVWFRQNADLQVV